MTVRDLVNAAADHGMIVKFKPGEKEVCAIVCPTCGFGANLFDQLMKGYSREPYSCPTCTIQTKRPSEGVTKDEINRRKEAMASVRSAGYRAA